MKKFQLKIALASVLLIASGTAVFSEQQYGWDAGFECLATGADISMAQKFANRMAKVLPKEYKNVTFREVAKMPASHSKTVNDILKYDNAAPGDLYTIIKVETAETGAIYLVFVQPGGKWTWWGWWTNPSTKAGER
ncbi:MAG: hypothetical protein MdMp014T_2993 [Treponematales bacterium]